MAREPNKRKYYRHVPASFQASFTTRQHAIIKEAIARGTIETKDEAEVMGRAANYLEEAAEVFSKYIRQEASAIRRANLDATRAPSGNAKLNDAKIAAITARLADGTPQAAIAREFNVSQMTISFVNQGKRVARDAPSGMLTRVPPLAPED